MIGDYPMEQVDSIRLSDRRTVLGLATLAPLLLLVIGLFLAPAIAQSQELLGDVALPASPIVINLDRATVTIVFEAEEDHAVRWWRTRPEEPGADALSVVRSEEGVFIQREERPEDESLADLVVEISAAPGHSLRLGGSGLDLTVVKEKEEEVEEEETDKHDLEDNKTAPTPATPTTVEFDLTESVVSIDGTGAVNGVGKSCAVVLRETTGNHVLNLSNSETRIASHRGNANLTAVDTLITVNGMRGLFSAQSNGGSLNLRSLMGRLGIGQQNGQIQIADCRGSGSLVAAGSNVDLRGLWLSKLTIRGEDSYITTANGSGTVAVNLDSGFFAMSGSKGSFSGNARNDADVELSDFVGDASLVLEEGASGDFARIRGALTLSSKNATATVNTAEALSFTTHNSFASLAGIGRLTSFQVDSSEVDLDLTDLVTERLDIAVESASRVSIRLSAPCRVQVSGASKNLGNRVDVTGCELKLGQRSRWSSRKVRGMDGRSPILLTAQVAESSMLIVEGRP